MESKAVTETLLYMYKDGPATQSWTKVVNFDED